MSYVGEDWSCEGGEGTGNTQFERRDLEFEGYEQ